MSNPLPEPAATPTYRNRTWQLAVGGVVASVFFAYTGFGGTGGILGIGKQWLRADYSHGFLVVPFAVYLLWRNRATLPTRFSWPDAHGVPLAVAPLGVFLMETKYKYAQEWVQGAALIASLAGVAVMFCGRWAGLRWAAPSLAMLFLTLPLPDVVRQNLSWQLQKVASYSSVYVFQLLGLPTHTPGPMIIVVNSAPLEIATACSGLSMLLTFVALTAAVVLLCPPTRPKIDRGVILLSAIPIAVVCNIGRIVISGLVLAAGWKQAFNLIVHDFFGWAMVLPALGLIWLEFWLIDWLLIPVTYMSREEVVRAGFAEARAEIEKQEAERKALHAAMAARTARTPEPTGVPHPAAPFLSLSQDGTSHGATAAGGTITRANTTDTPPPQSPAAPGGSESPK